MRSTLDELTKELEDLTTLVASIAPVNTALAEHQDSLVRQYLSVRRRFDYPAFAVAIYASFEKFIERLVAAFAQLESRRLEYAELPPKLVKKHIRRTAEMLSRGRIGEGRLVGLTELDVVKNLFECLSGARPYALNEAAVVAHDRNLRASEVDTLFAAVGIEQICERVRRADALVEWYCKVKELGTAPRDGVPSVLIEERIKDLVERRNQVAHRGGSPLDLLGVDEMRESVGFIQAFSQSVFAIAVGDYLSKRHAISPASIQLPQRQGDGPYQNGMVVVVEKPSQRLFVGQPLFVIVEAAGARWGRVRSIRVDNTEVEAVEAGDHVANGVGLGLNFTCPKGATLVALASEDDVVWGPPPGG